MTRHGGLLAVAVTSSGSGVPSAEGGASLTCVIEGGACFYSVEQIPPGQSQVSTRPRPAAPSSVWNVLPPDVSPACALTSFQWGPQSLRRGSLPARRPHTPAPPGWLPLTRTLSDTLSPLPAW